MTIEPFVGLYLELGDAMSRDGVPGHPDSRGFARHMLRFGARTALLSALHVGAQAFGFAQIDVHDRPGWFFGIDVH